MGSQRGRSVIAIAVSLALSVLAWDGASASALGTPSLLTENRPTTAEFDDRALTEQPDAPGVVEPSGEDQLSRPVTRLLIKYAPGVVAPMGEGARISETLGTDAELTSGPSLGLGWSTAVLAAPLDASAAHRLAADIAASPAIDVAEPDIRLQPSELPPWPNDALYPSQWSLSSFGDSTFIDANDGEIGQRVTGINWREAISDVSAQVPTVAVLDTGFTVHPELDGNIVPGYDFISDVRTANDGDGRDSNAADPGNWITPQESTEPPFSMWGCGPRTSDWHGTHVMGTLSATANNATGIAGVAPGVQVQPVRVLGKCGGTAGDVAAAIVWAAGGLVPGVPENPTPARVVNMSLGGFAQQCPFAIEDAIDYAASKGTVVVVAAGNANDDVRWYAPANCEGAVTVAAYDEWGARAPFSNFGQYVDLAAPGVGIVSTINTGGTAPASSGYASYSGTSMAAPHVSGAAALLIGAQPHLSAAAVQQYLKDSATPFKGSGAEGRGAGDFTAGAPATDCLADDSCGAGYLNAGAMLQRVSAPEPPTTVRHTIGVDPHAPGASLIEVSLAPARFPVDAYLVTVSEGSTVVENYVTTELRSSASVRLTDPSSEAVRISVRATRFGVTGVETSSMRVPSFINAPPAKPTVVHVQPGNRKLVVSMRGGYSVPEISFMVARAQPGGAGCRFLPLTTQGTCTIAGLANGQQYSITVEALASGITTVSDPVVASPLASAPPSFAGPPTVIAQGSQAQVSWPPAVGGNPIDYYVVRTAPATRTSCVVHATAGVQSCTLANVPTGAPFNVYVLAVDSAGESGYSDPSAEFTLNTAAIAPGAPTSAPGVHGGATEAVVSLEPDGLPWYWGGAPDASRGVRVVASPGGGSCEPQLRYDTTMWCKISGLVSGTEYTFRAYAFTAAGTSEASDPSVPIVATEPANEPFVPVAPVRVADTRIGQPVAIPTVKQPLMAGAVLEIPVAGRFGVPASAKAVALNVTAVHPHGAGHLRVYPCGQSRPNSSTVNFAPWVNVANSAYVRVGSEGKVCVYAAAGTDVVVDLNGWFPAGANYEAAVPVRLADTRAAQPVPFPSVKRKVQGGSVLEVPLLGRAGIPNVAAMVVLNVTAVNAEGAGHLRVYPCDATRPNASTVNFRPGFAAPNLAVVNVSGEGKACIYAGTTTDVLVDLSGWFHADSRIDGSVPKRLVDTRRDHPEAPPLVKWPLQAGQTMEVRVTGGTGVQLDVRAVILNVTAVNSVADGHLRVYPCDQLLPNASVVDYLAGNTVANSATVKPSPDGYVCVYSSATTDVLVDLNAWYPAWH